jgi:hypothetical protein
VNRIDTEPISRDKVEDNRPLMLRLNDVLTYAIRGNGWAVMIGGTLAFGLLGMIAGWARLGGESVKTLTFVHYLWRVVYYALWFPAVLYMLAFSHRIMRTTAEGRDELPDWPNPAELWDEILRPLSITGGVILISVGPALAVEYLTGQRGGWYWLALVAGIAYLPLALLATVVQGTLAAASPATVVPAVFKMQGDYLLSLSVLAATILVCSVVVPVLGRLLLVGPFVEAGLMMYATVTMSHLLAQSYHANRIAVGWIHKPVIKPVEQEQGGGAAK